MSGGPSRILLRDEPSDTYTDLEAETVLAFRSFVRLCLALASCAAFGLAPSPSAADLYRNHCSGCHGANMEGVARSKPSLPSATAMFKEATSTQKPVRCGRPSMALRVATSSISLSSVTTMAGQKSPTALTTTARSFRIWPTRNGWSSRSSIDRPHLASVRWSSIRWTSFRNRGTGRSLVPFVLKRSSCSMLRSAKC